jgi:predicted esterase
VHGDEDRVVSHKWGHGSHELLKSLAISPPPQFATIEGMGHSSDPEEMDLVKAFLKNVFSA